MSENKIRYFYLSDSANPRRRACIARKIVGKEGEELTVQYAWSLNNPVDNFNKKIARAMATKRLERDWVLNYNPNEKNPLSVKVGSCQVTVPAGKKVIETICSTLADGTISGTIMDLQQNPRPISLFGFRCSVPLSLKRMAAEWLELERLVKKLEPKE